MAFDIDNFFDIDTKFPYDKEKEAFVEHMDFLKTMSVQESTLYKKWKELNIDEYKLGNKVSHYENLLDRIWKPTDITDKNLTISEIEKLEPYVHIAESVGKWSLLRTMVSSMEFSANPGRNIKFYVKDKVTENFLGVISVGSDVTSLKVRDDYIGWNKENKFDHHKLNNTTIGTSIIPTQPLGFNFLGGKLISALVTSSTIRDKWYSEYNDILVGVTTTSLYGIHSQYNGIPHWKTLGESAGKVGLKPDDEFYDKWHDWIKENRKEEYDKKILTKGGKSGPVTGVKQRILSIIFNELGISQSKYQHGFKRGVFFSEIYDNTRPFLRGEIKEDELVLKKRLDNDVESIVSWWQKKSLKRYFKLHEQNRLKPEMLFYADMIGKSWEEAKEKYLGEVGR